jgi:pimeloyl-ACP methyl ester carboxylesterase
MYRALFVAPPLYLRLARPLFFLAYRSAAVQEVVTTVEESQAFDDRDLARLDRPVGLVWGERDSLFRLEAGQAMARALPTARLEVVADAGHAVQWEKTAEFLAAVDRLRARFPPSPGGRPPAPPVLP